MNLFIFSTSETLTRSCIYRLYLFAIFQVPETNVGIKRTGCSYGQGVADVHRHYTQLMSLQTPLQVQPLITPSVGDRERGFFTHNTLSLASEILGPYDYALPVFCEMQNQGGTEEAENTRCSQV